MKSWPLRRKSSRASVLPADQARQAGSAASTSEPSARGSPVPAAGPFTPHSQARSKDGNGDGGGRDRRKSNTSTPSSPGTPRRNAPLLFRPRPSSLVSVTTTGELPSHSSSSSINSDFEASVAGHGGQTAAGMRAAGHHPVSVSSSAHESAIAHLASTQQRDERARLLRKSSSAVSLSSTHSAGASGVAGGDGSSSSAGSDEGIAGKNDDHQRHALPPPARTRQPLKDRNPQQSTQDVVPLPSLMRSSSGKARKPLVGPTSTTRDTSNTLGEGHDEKPTTSVSSGADKHDGRGQDQTMAASRASAPAPQANKHLDMGRSTESALRALQQIHGVAHLDNDRRRAAAAASAAVATITAPAATPHPSAAEDALSIREQQQTSPFLYTVRGVRGKDKARTNQPMRGDAATAEDGGHSAHHVTSHSVGTDDTAAQARCEVHIVRGRVVGLWFPAMGHGPRRTRSLGGAVEAQRHDKKRHGFSTAERDSRPSSTPRAAAPAQAPAHTIVPLVAMPVPRFLRCSAFVYWSTERASRLAACVTALLGS